MAANVVRFGTVWCPHWPVVAAGVGEGAAIVLRADRVVAHSVGAGELGVRVGQRRREAQSLCPGARVVAADPVREARAFESIALAVGDMVPRLEVTEPGTLAFAARGPSRYLGGDEAMAARIGELAATAAPAASAAVGGFTVGVADGRFAAAVAARRAARLGEPVVVAPGAEATRAFLAPLTVRLLATVAGLDDAFVGLLGRMGIRRLGDLAALPPTAVLARFGHPGVFAHDLAGGGDPRPPAAHDPPPGRCVEHAFEEPVLQTDTLVFVARQLAGDLGGRLADDGLVCTRLVVTAETDHGERSERVWHRSDGLGVAAMVERVRWQLDAWVAQAALTAGVVLLRLEPEEVRADDGVQLGLWGGRTQADEWATRAVARLATIAGEQQVLVPEAAGGRQPVDDHRWVPAVLVDLADQAASAARLRVGDEPWPGRLPSPSPILLHAVPVPVEVVDVEGQCVGVSGRGLLSTAPAALRQGSVTEQLAGWAGPWPVEERWWDGARARRAARFQLLTVAGRLLLVVIERQCWLVVAEYA
ncbi:MAG: DNA polymerase Y family protein [Ilumatobacteraceae bacterium]